MEFNIHIHHHGRHDERCDTILADAICEVADAIKELAAALKPAIVGINVKPGEATPREPEPQKKEG